MEINRNYIIIFCTVVIIILIVLIPSIMIVSNAYKDNLGTVTEKRIIEAAVKCYKMEICTTNKITLQMLYDNNFLVIESDPLTKEIYNTDSYVLIEEDSNKFIVLN